MTMSTDMSTAFTVGAGVSASDAHDALVLILAGLMLLFLAWMTAKLGERVLDGRLKAGQAGFYMLRALLLAALIVGSLLQ